MNEDIIKMTEDERKELIHLLIFLHLSIITRTDILNVESLNALSELIEMHPNFSNSELKRTIEKFIKLLGGYKDETNS